jgi:hypothetical protein
LATLRLTQPVIEGGLADLVAHADCARLASRRRRKTPEEVIRVVKRIRGAAKTPQIRTLVRLSQCGVAILATGVDLGEYSLSKLQE